MHDSLPARRGLVLLCLLTACTRGHSDVQDSDSTGQDTVDTTDTWGDSDDSGGTIVEAHFLDDGVANLLLPHHVSVDRARGLAYVVSLIAPTVAAVDLATDTFIGAWTVADNNPELPETSVDGAGTVFMSGLAYLAMLRGTTGHADRADVGLVRIATVVAQDDGAVLTGVGTDNGDWAVRVDGDGAVLTRAPLSGPAVAATSADDGAHVAVLETLDRETSVVEVLDPTTLEVLTTCPANSSGITITQIADGRYILPHDAGIGQARCDGGTSVERAIGIENKGAFPYGAGVVILDRIGTSAEAGPNWGVARTFDADLNEAGPSFSTGKNSGLGDMDAYGNIWTNSEGTTEIWGMNPATGLGMRRVRVGVHLETLIQADDEPGIAWVTGRLSQLVARVDLHTGEILASHAVDGWPVSPVLHDDRLYFLDHLDQNLYAYDRDTLELIERYDLGLGDNVLLVFDSVVVDPASGLFYITAAQDNVLIEWSPTSGAELRRWTLAGDPITDPGLAGKLDVLISGGRVYTLRSVDGTFSVVDLQADALHGYILTEPEVVLRLFNQALPAPLWAPEDGSLVYVAGYAYDPDTLDEVVSERRDIDKILGVRDGQLIAWRVASNDIVALDAGGAVLDSTEMELPNLMNAPPSWSPGWGGRVVYLNNEKGAVQVVELN